MKNILSILVGSAALAGSALAGSTGYPAKDKAPVAPPVAPPPVTCGCFGAGESALDIFAAYGTSGSEYIDGEFGGGVRYSQFITRNIGFAVGYSIIGSEPIHDLSTSFVARFPIEAACIAPYVYGGPGGYFNSSNELTFHAGAGLDVRLFGCNGLFVDYKHTFADSDDYGLVSAGFRLSF